LQIANFKMQIVNLKFAFCNLQFFVFSCSVPLCSSEVRAHRRAYLRQPDADL